MTKRKPGEIAQKTITRRTWLEWTGKSAAVISLQGFLARCHLDGPGGNVDAANGPDAGPDARPGPDAATDPLCEHRPSEDFPFEPGNTLDEVFRGWGERTVDRQDLESILASWRLTVDGLVDAPRILTFADLLCLERQDMVVDFHCVEGWSVFDVPWNGVHLSRIFELVRPRPEATHVTFHTIGGTYNESLPLDIALEPRTLLAYGINGNTLPLKHGFPLRIVIPRLLAYKSAKYVYRLELANKPVEGFWVAAGFSYDAPVPESRLRDGRY